MKKILSVILLLLSTVVGTISLAASTSWGSQGSDPIDILKQVKQDSTVSDHDSLQKTALDDVEGDGTMQSVLASIQENLGPYIQWATYIGLTISTILIIYNGILLVLTPISGKMGGAVKGRILNITLGIVVITGVFFILQLIMSLVGRFT